MIGLRLSALVGGSDPTAAWARAIVQVGGCSGVLVGDRAVLTSAHCVEGRVDSVVVGSRPARVSECVKYPGYRAGQASDDMAVCRLAETAAAAPLALDDGPQLVAGIPVTLAGFGQTGPFSRQDPQLRAVDTVIARAATDLLEVGSDHATACRGDSGGPVLVVRGDQARVSAILQGASGAICASPARAVPVQPRTAWIHREVGAASEARGLPWMGLGLLVAIAGVAWRLRSARGRARGTAARAPLGPP